ncbi:hypothetical protein CPB83DRAFT_858613 [Crepidotus variabilis]|uniref:Fruit-body specific protein a n=1 Tax=Crepidotus variabilis TaxID=179855 RepID=A0A9P6JMW2_9AGAR|nr:hypothetical protein CPB83DRAFT_858613 [Crepidotus variabilis]
MRFSTLFAVTALAVSSVFAEPQLSLTALIGFNVDVNNHYGAPYPPWVPGALPGWYYGDHPELFPGTPLFCLLKWFCAILQLFPGALHCPSHHQIPPPVPNDGYTQTFHNLTGATQASDYITFGLVDTVADCKAMCNSVSGCGFANTYHDVNGKNGSPQLTCSLFTTCHGASDATNTGGQSQPDGTIDYITNSDGWCKST